MAEYFLIVKTGEAEIRALENTTEARICQILPLIELTRGRKKTVGEVVIHPFNKRLDRLKKVFKRQKVAIDVTTDESLFSEEILRLYDSKDGYKNWKDFLNALKKEDVFSEIIPALLINFEDNPETFERNIKDECEFLEDNFGQLLYRSSIEDDGCYNDVELILGNIQRETCLYIVIDCGYVQPAMWRNTADKCCARIRNLKEILTQHSRHHIIVCSTSYPNNVNDLGGDDYDIYDMSEIRIFNETRKVDSEVIYGDYGSINPKRNDDVTMARGWIPKIDVPSTNSTFYYRKRRPQGITTYAGTYMAVAQDVIQDAKFPKDLTDVWGIEQIEKCATDYTPSSVPSFWISVRMNIHIAQQLKRINAEGSH